MSVYQLCISWWKPQLGVYNVKRKVSVASLYFTSKTFLTIKRNVTYLLDMVLYLCNLIFFKTGPQQFAALHPIWYSRCNSGMPQCSHRVGGWQTPPWGALNFILGRYVQHKAPKWGLKSWSFAKVRSKLKIFKIRRAYELKFEPNLGCTAGNSSNFWQIISLAGVKIWYFAQSGSKELNHAATVDLKNSGRSIKRCSWPPDIPIPPFQVSAPPRHTLTERYQNYMERNFWEGVRFKHIIMSMQQGNWFVCIMSIFQPASIFFSNYCRAIICPML